MNRFFCDGDVLGPLDILCDDIQLVKLDWGAVSYGKPWFGAAQQTGHFYSGTINTACS